MEKDDNSQRTKSKLDKIAEWIESKLVGILIAGFILIVFGPWLLTLQSPLPSFGSDGEVGDTFGGITAPIIGLITILLIFLTYHSQKNELKETRDTAEKQAEIMAQQQFESTFFEMLKVHRDNVAQIAYNSQNKGRDAFLMFSNEFKEILWLIHENVESENNKKQKSVLSQGSEEAGIRIPTKPLDNPEKLNPEDYIKIAYLIFYFGVRPSSRKVLEDVLWRELKDRNFDPTEIETIILYFYHVKAYYSSERKWPAFLTGNPHNLSHYFRHLFQTVSFVDQNKNLRNITNWDDIDNLKRFYVKQLRTQLSVFELDLFFANSLTVLGSDWEWVYRFNDDLDSSNYLITKYELIRNIPHQSIGFYKQKDNYESINFDQFYPGIKYEDEDFTNFQKRFNSLKGESGCFNPLSLKASPKQHLISTMLL